MTTTNPVADAAATLLAKAAFGSECGRWPLPVAVTGDELWLRAVAAGGQGRYASAFADLARLRREAPRRASPALSAHASFLRQLGWHELARGWDGRALAESAADPVARADALIGLAADALGVGRFALSARLLSTVTDPGVGQSARTPVRLGWVLAELHMVQGDGAEAVRHAEAAAARAADLGSVRHTVKSQVVLAAALCCAGAVGRSRRVADAALAETGRHGLLPLRWALACLLSDVGSGTYDARRIRAIRDETAHEVGLRGGTWRR